MPNFINKKDKYMWLDKLRELKKEKGMSAKQIATATRLPERTITRILSGETDNPYMDTVRLIVDALDGSLDDIFAEGSVVIGNKNLKTLQEELNVVKAEASALKDQVSALSVENEMLKMQIKFKDEIIALHNYYNKLKTSD